MNKKLLQGSAFVATIALLIGLSIAQYAGVFRAGVPVLLKASSAGSQLNPRSDVKVRGLIVGQVDKITTRGDGADIELSLQPDKVDVIPQNVTALLLPKTLFGEKYVSLVPPEVPSAAHIKAGDVIDQDHSKSARELETTLDDLEPVLTAVQPQKLASTLGAVSQGLSGRGEQLGHTLVELNKLVKGLSPSVPALQEDLRQLATFSNNLADAAPDLLKAADDLTVTTNTIVDQKQNLRDVYRSVTTASDDLRSFLDANGQNLISLTASARPTLESLARYAPEFPCFFKQIEALLPLARPVFGQGTNAVGLHITLEISTSNRGKYLPNQDEPQYLDDRGPRCYPAIKPFPQYAPDGPFRDGSVPPPSLAPNQPKGNPENFGIDTYGTYNGSNSWGLVRGGPAKPGGAGGLPLPLPLPGLAAPASWRGVDMGLPNSPAEQNMVSMLVGAQQGRSASEVPGWSSLLVGPLYRGSEVTVT